MMIYMINDTGACATNNKATAWVMETAGYRQCSMDEYRAQMKRQNDNKQARLERKQHGDK